MALTERAKVIIHTKMPRHNLELRQQVERAVERGNIDESVLDELLSIFYECEIQPYETVRIKVRN